MLSTVPAFSFSEPGLVTQFSGFQTGFTPWEWDSSDLIFSVNQFEPVVPSPCYGEYDIGSVRINPGLDDIKTGSDEFYADFTKNKAGFDDADTPNCLPCSKPDSDNANFYSGEQNHYRKKPSKLEITEERERKRKRKESNRESAKRSRLRRQSHIDNLRNEVNRLDLENRELRNRLQIVLYQLQRVNTDNNRLLTEQEILRFRLSEMRQILILRQQFELHNRRMMI